MEIKRRNEQFYVGDDPENPMAEMTMVLNGTKQLIVDHTMVSDELRGQGIGDKLLEAVVNYARENNRQMIPTCPFAKARLEKNRDQYADVLSENEETH